MDIEREDGEIVDDDDEFEEVSDCSITSTHSGKSEAYQDIISSVSLSSISESEFEPKRRYEVRERYRPHRKKRKSRSYVESCSRKQCRKYADSMSESEDDCMDRSILRQLKEAVKINSSVTNSNSLELRLKRMLNVPLTHEDIETNGSDVSQDFNSDNFGKLDTKEEKDEDIEMLRSMALNTKFDKKDVIMNKQSNKNGTKGGPDAFLNKNDSIDDQELTELRLAALKSAVIKKHMKRKKQKELEIQKQVGQFQNGSNEIDKENTQDVINNQEHYNSESKSMENNNNEKIDTASKTIEDRKSEEMTGISNNALNKSVEEDVDIMRAMLLASMSNKITSIKPVLASSVKSLTKLYPSTIKNTKNKLINVYKKAVVSQIKPTNLQKQPMVDIPVKPLIININGESDSDTDSEVLNKTAVDKNDSIALKVTELLKKTRAEVEAKTQEEKTVPHKAGESKPDKSSDSLLLDKSIVKLLPKSQQIEYRLLKQKLLNAKKKINQNSQKVTEDKRKEPKINGPNNNFIEAAISNDVEQQTRRNKQPLKEVVKELEEIYQNGRLQMKGKYTELAPLLQKIKLARMQVKKMDNSLKKLIEEMDKVKRKLHGSKQRYTYLMKEICLRKQIIDRRLQMTNLPSDNITNVVSSTPIKQANTVVEIETFPEPAEEKNETQPKTEENDIATDQSTESNNFAKYISPLGASTSGNSSDPLGTCCPYDIFGVCKDPECTYKHYS